MKVETFTINLFIKIHSDSNKQYCESMMEYYNIEKIYCTSLAKNQPIEDLILKGLTTSLEQLKKSCQVKIKIEQKYCKILDNILSSIYSSNNTLNLDNFYFQKAINLSKTYYLTTQKPSNPFNKFDIDKNLTPPITTKIRQITEKDLQKYKEKINQPQTSQNSKTIKKFTPKIKKSEKKPKEWTVVTSEVSQYDALTAEEKRRLRESQYPTEHRYKTKYRKKAR